MQSRSASASGRPRNTQGLTHAGRIYRATTQRISTGVPRLDAMLGGKGYFRGSSILISGGAGTGKSTLAAAFVQATCGRGEKAMYFSFEESQDQIIRNMRSVGIDLAPWAENGQLQFHSVRPNFQGLEMHLLQIHDRVLQFKPRAVVIDPVTNLTMLGDELEVRGMLTRLIDYFKSQQVSTVFTSLTGGGESPEQARWACHR